MTSVALIFPLFGRLSTTATASPITLVQSAAPTPNNLVAASVVAIHLAALVAMQDEDDKEQADDRKPKKPDSPKTVTNIKFGDGKADGKKSIAGTGQMIRFELPNKAQRLRGLRIHAARYGQPRAPDEDIQITIEDDKRENIVGSEVVPYGKFKRGTSRWVSLVFDEPIEVPAGFWVTVDFAAEQTKGVYVSYDTATKGEHSRTGLPGAESKPVTFGGDWMMQAVLTKPE